MNYIVLDTETTNGFDDPIAYDCGWAVINEEGQILKKRSFVVADIFIEEPQLMKEAYFSDKIPQYFTDIADGKRELRRFAEIRNKLYKDCKMYNVQAIMAHNMFFDYRSCTKTQRWLTSSKYRYFFPYGVPLWDTLKMARQTFGQDENYKQWCIKNNYTIKNSNRPRLTAEILYRYITNNNDFVENHTGLEDVEIEKEIFVQCMKMNPNIERECWSK